MSFSLYHRTRVQDYSLFMSYSVYLGCQEMVSSGKERTAPSLTETQQETHKPLLQHNDTRSPQLRLRVPVSQCLLC